jgi:hypothetical protein
MWTLSPATRTHYLKIGVVLCLLAALFAIEAKLAWYAPDNAPASQISASKLLAADAPRIAALAVASSLAAQLFWPAILLLSMAFPVAPIAFARLTAAHLPKPPSFSFSPSLFFRPPPIR